jgi:hypothetical protein
VRERIVVLDGYVAKNAGGREFTVTVEVLGYL